MHRITIRLIALALYAAVTALFGALIAGPWVHALPADTLGLWGIGTLVVFAAGAFTTALMTMAGIIGIGIAILLFVVAGNPSAGGAYGWALLPPFWAAIGPWLPPGAGADAVRGAAYFGNAGITRDLLVLAGYAAAGIVLSYATVMLLGRGRRKRRGRSLSRPPEALSHAPADAPDLSGAADTGSSLETAGTRGASGVPNAGAVPDADGVISDVYGAPDVNGMGDERGMGGGAEASDASGAGEASGAADSGRPGDVAADARAGEGPSPADGLPDHGGVSDADGRA